MPGRRRSCRSAPVAGNDAGKPEQALLPLDEGGISTQVIPIGGARRPPSAATRAPSPRARRRRRSAPRRVLIVDDNHDHVVSLAAVLEAMGHEVRAEYDGGAALDAVADYRPHVVILDIGLPVLDGYEVARCLRAAYPDRSLRLIALTGYGQARDGQHAKEAGFDSFMIKPPDNRALNALLSGDKRAKRL
jgi:CheY-like chemotaxis protein